MSDTGSCCCAPGPVSGAYKDQKGPWICGELEVAYGQLKQVAGKLQLSDLAGAVKVRLGFGRKNYKVEPGLYGVGQPGQSSPVLVSANYKLSFDALRKAVARMDVWILVIDTDGVNVWCAAGKGTFGTDEIVKRVKQVRLEEVVSHRELIVPQLGAPGVAAHVVKKESSFKVTYGPVYADDLPDFIDNGKKAAPGMRQVRFSLADRLKVTPVELTQSMKFGVLAFLVFLLFNWLISGEVSFQQMAGKTFDQLWPFLAALVLGAVGVPALLPLLPGPSFVIKGWTAGLIWAVCYSILWPLSWLRIAAVLLGVPAITAFLGFNFTGCTTYTSLSGVQKEMTLATPPFIVTSAGGFIFLILSIIL